MPSFSKTFSARSGKLRIDAINKGLDQIRTKLKNLQVDRTYVKAGLLGKKATKRRPKPRVEDVSGFAGLSAEHRAIVVQLIARKGEQIASSEQPTNVELGVIHEFGTAHIPARPFIKPPFLKHKAEYLELLIEIVNASVYAGNMRLERALGIIGAKMAADQKNYVTQGPQIPPPNQGYPDHGYWLRKLMQGQRWRDDERARRRRKGLPVKEGPDLPPRTLVDTGRMIGSITWAVIQLSSGDLKEGGK